MYQPKMIIRFLIFVAAFATQLLFANRTQSIDVRVLRLGTQVSFSKNAPPIAALEDEKLAPLSSEEINRAKMALLKNSLVPGIVKVTVKRRIAFLKPLRIQKPSVLSRTVRMAELKITKNAPEVVVASELILPSVAQAATNNFVEHLPEDLKPRAKNAPELRKWVDSDWTEGSVSKTLDNLITAAGPPIVPEGAGVFSLQQPAPQNLSPLVNRDPAFSPNQTHGPSLETVVGSFELGDGLASWNPDQFRVFHRKDGTLLRMGQITDFSKGEFRIQVSRDIGGELVAELRSDSDRIIGTGRMILADAFKAKRPILKVKEENNHTIAQVNSGDSLPGSSVPVSGVNMHISGLGSSWKTNSQGLLATKGLEPGSTFEWFASKEGFWPTRSSGHADWPNQLMLFPNRMMEAMFGVLGIQKFDRTQGVVWGQVKNRGVPLEGARVRLEESDVAPVYFTGPFPNSRLSETSSNGIFAFFQVKPGLHLVRTQANGSDLPTKVVEVERSVVTTVDVSTSKALSAQVQTYDGLAGDPVTASVQLTGTHRVATASDGRLNLKYSEGVDPLMLDVFSGPLSLMARISGDRFQKNQRAPIVKIAWLEELFQRAGMIYNTSRSLIVGFVQGKDFIADVSFASHPEAFSPLYFDSQGNPVLGSQKGIAGGGVIFANLPEGFATVVIKGAADAGTGAPYLHRLYIDPRAAGVFSKDLSIH